MRLIILLMVGGMMVGALASSASAASIENARNLAGAALAEVKDFNQKLVGIGKEALKINNGCRNARALIANKRASLNGQAVQAIQKVSDQKDTVAALFPAVEDQIPVMGDKIQSVSQEVSSLTHDGALDPFRSNKILDKLDEAQNLLPVIDPEVQSLSQKLSDDLVTALDDAVSALQADDSETARKDMNECLAIMRDFERLRSVVSHIRTARIARLLNESKLLLRQTGPLKAGAGRVDLSPATRYYPEAAALRVRFYAPDGRLLWTQESAGLTLRWEETSGRAKGTLADGVYLAVIDVQGPDGKVLKSELKKFILRR